MYLNEEDINMLDGSIIIMKNMYKSLRELDASQANVNLLESKDKKEIERYKRKDGKDTRRFDIVAEEAICLGLDYYTGHYSWFQKAYDLSGVVITEERGRIPRDRRIEHNTPVIISDPVDRSSHLDEIVGDYSSKYKNLGEVFDAEREKIGEDHARVESCNSSVTLLKDNMIKYSLILSLFTGEMFLAYEPGVFSADINKVDSYEDFKQRIHFKENETSTILFYCEERKDNKYENNRLGTRLRFFDLDKDIISPGGPNRFTYLIKDIPEEVSKVGLIAHNGEKIQESLPNIAVAFFSDGELQAYKLFCDRKYSENRAGKQLTPNLQNSIYENGLLINTGIKTSHLNNHYYPSEFRDTTVVVPTANKKAMHILQGMVTEQYAIRII